MQGSNLTQVEMGRYLYLPHLCLLIISSEFYCSALTFLLCFLIGIFIDNGRIETVTKIMGGFHQSLSGAVISFNSSSRCSL